jgi:signal transduction histidine kinase
LTESVLIVEDQRAFAFALSEVLSGEGYRVETAGSVPDALAKIDRERFDAALLDLRVGADSGLQVLDRLKHTSPNTAALILTGYGSLETAIQAMRAGASDYLLKPCDPQELKAAVARGLKQRRAEGPGTTYGASEEAARALEQALRARDDFLAIAGHELKTPLSAVIGWAQYVQRQLARGDAEGLADKLEIVVGQAQRLSRLIDTFGEVVRLEHGGLTFDKERRDLRVLADGAVVDARRAHRRHDFQVVLCEVPAWVLVDRLRLSQVLDNLLENAAKFAPDGTRVTVRVQTSGDLAEVSIRDQGIGIAAEELTRIFDRFYQADQDVLSRRFGGVGIGLYLSRMLIQAHGGRLWAESDGANQGSTFTLTLPLAPPGPP